VGSALTLPVTSPENGGSWTLSSVLWNSGANTTAILSIVDTNIGASYNDFALDDISLSAVPSQSAIPEPSTLVMSSILFGMFGAGGLRKRLTRTTPA
jgi:hypothetical protein